MSWCAIDFGTSNSALAVGGAGRAPRLVALEDGETSMPTAVFYCVDPDPEALPAGVHRAAGTLPRAYGRAAVRAYVDGHEGRLMRSMKSILGSDLVRQSTDVGHGHAVRYVDVVAGYLRHLRALGEAAAAAPLGRAVLGRPVFFVDDDPARDAAAEAALCAAARAVGFADVRFQYEPIAAAFDYEQRAAREERVLVADIGGGTSDFSVVRVGPARRGRAERRDDILAHHGVHVAGTDFDRHVELARILPPLGYRSRGPGGREVPSRVYFDLATWHLINTVYRPQRVAELRAMAGFYADAREHRRLLRVVEQRLGHELAAKAEAAKIASAGGATAAIDLGRVEPGLAATLEPATTAQAIEADLARIVEAARATLRLAGVAPGGIDAVYFTGGSTGLAALRERLAALCPGARAVEGDRQTSVAAGLALHAASVFG